MNFLLSVRKRKPKVSDIGLNGQQNIFVRESLSTYNLKIFKECIALKRKGLINSVFSNNGFIYLRRTNNKEEKPVRVKSPTELCSLAATLTVS